MIRLLLFARTLFGAHLFLLLADKKSSFTTDDCCWFDLISVYFSFIKKTLSVWYNIVSSKIAGSEDIATVLGVVKYVRLTIGPSSWQVIRSRRRKISNQCCTQRCFDEIQFGSVKLKRYDYVSFVKIKVFILYCISLYLPVTKIQ